MDFNYNRLRGRIREVCGTQANFARRLGLSQASLSYKLNGNIDFDQSEIATTANVLNFKSEEIPDYFFTPKVQKK